MAQDLPPIGGYEPVQWKRNLPSRGFRPTIYFWGITGLMAFGFYRLYQGADEQRELSRERQWSRFYLEPLLLAEEDRNIARRYYSEKARQELVRDSMSEEVKAKFDQEIYNDKSKFRFPKYIAGPSSSER
ncbi:GRIM-19 protein-domain-containing protein [Scheffersomyces amazonensis]|uniref:GRIM-19 protein-domain-containing protein n=1 Tax=Scheffersomyces amazonensis TaxID=1078765 RepID=UPI00315D1D20